MAVFDGPGSYYGTHPQNILRGMVYEDREIPYFQNIVDQYRAMAKYNRGYAYNMMFVGPGWMSKSGRWEAPYDLLLKSYQDGMAYYGQLKKEGKAHDVTMTEFADHLPPAAAPTPAPSAPSGRTSSTAPGASSSGTPTPGCASAWT